MAGKFNSGDWIEIHGNRYEVSYWPETDDGFAVYTQHRADGASSIFTEHTSILINHARLIEHGDYENLPNVDPAIGNVGSNESVPAKKAPVSE